MAGSSFLSDSDDSSAAVEELISQAQELCVLEQVSAINCAGFTDSVLPSDLESRFRKLKSFPVTKPKSSFTDHKPLSAVSDQKNEVERAVKDEEMEHNLNPPRISVSSPLDSSNLVMEDLEFSPFSKKHLKSKRNPNSFSSPLGSSKSSTDSPSPPRKSGCFWCSPKNASSKKNKGNRVVRTSLDWDMQIDDEFLSDLMVFSTKKQQKILKQAMKEEEKINREAEKIVKWARQASERMNSYGVEDELSEDDSVR